MVNGASDTKDAAAGGHWYSCGHHVVAVLDQSSSRKSRNMQDRGWLGKVKVQSAKVEDDEEEQDKVQRTKQ